MRAIKLTINGTRKASYYTSLTHLFERKPELRYKPVFTRITETLSRKKQKYIDDNITIERICFEPSKCVEISDSE